MNALLRHNRKTGLLFLWWAETVMFFVMIGFITTDIAPIGHNVE
jgi:hypothetical protein